jgi:hypothetical protein
VLVSIGCSVALNEAPPGPDLANDVLQVCDAAGEAIDAGDHQYVARMEEIENDAQLVSPLRGRAAALLGSDDVTAGRPQGGFLN